MTPRDHKIKPLAFTIMELLVVMAIIVILVLVSVPSIKAITKGNGVIQSNNAIRAALANARAAAISQHRQAGVVFFEESSTYSNPVNRNQTAMQLIIQDVSQNPPTPGQTLFTYYSKERQYLPAGLAVATLSDTAITTPNGVQTNVLRTADSSAAFKARVIIFDENGQLVLHDGIVHSPPGGGTPGTYPMASEDWSFPNSGDTTLADGESSPGLLIYDLAAYKAENFTSDGQRGDWFQKNGAILIINNYTGGLIQ